MKLTIQQRFFVAGIYLLLILVMGYYLRGSLLFITDTSDRLNSLLIVIALGLILGTYISEPFFSKPVEVVARWIAIFLFIIGLKDRENLILYKIWLILSVSFVVVALILIFMHRYNRFEKAQRIAVDIICKISRPNVVFTLLYLSIVVSFFDPSTLEYPLLIGFGFLLAVNKPVILLAKWISKLFSYSSSKNDLGDYLGQVIGHENAFLYNIELENSNTVGQRELKGSLVFLENITNAIVGIVLNEKILLGKKWCQILSLKDTDNNLISFNIKSLKPLANEKSIFSKTNAVFLLDKNSTEENVRSAIDSNPVYKSFKHLIGTVYEGSTISKIKFNKLFSDELLTENGLGEGSIIQTTIAGKEVLYQIIDARTDEESLEFKDTHGFTISTAQKLGEYSLQYNELSTVKWLPEMYTPIFLLAQKELEYDPNKFIGKLPNTNYGIAIKNIQELVTHNTAILGILGIGKSCLTFELIQKLVHSSDTKIICLDITGQYFPTLSKYLNHGSINEVDYDSIEQKINTTYRKINKDVEEGGNYKDFKHLISQEINIFMAISSKKVLIINPQRFNVSYQVGEVKNKKIGPGQNDWAEIAPMRDLTVAEISRLVAEESLELCKAKGITENGRLLLVFEEAHSLIPEWNSVANEGDKSATNGTAKVILQGRKYGLGSMVITQRTANISKSILNQCNTIFALRVFDDTGKQFLENYIGSEYSNLLPTLEERHCVAIGKAMKLKQPVILELNDMNEIIKNEEEPNDIVVDLS